MGIMKDFGDMMKGANEMTKAAQEQQAAAQKAQAEANQPVDLNDPMWVPIEGVTVDKYAEITALMLKKGIMGVEQVNAFAESMGVPSGKWQVVQNGWVQRMGQHMAVRTRYGNLYNEYSK
jgi:hypothetical protein